MTTNKGRAGPIAGMLVVLALALAAPAGAHEGERHPTPAEQSQTEPNASAEPAPHDMSDMDPAELRWPTAEEMSAMPGHGDARPTTFWGRLVRWLGAWHPAIVHFPVALLLTVAFLEFAAAVRGKPIYNASNKILLAVGTLSAFVAAPLGWISAGLPPDDEFALTVHRWLGTALPFLFLALWALKKPAEQAAVRKSPPYYEALLGLVVLAIVVQAFFGAEVTHGAEHLAF